MAGRLAIWLLRRHPDDAQSPSIWIEQKHLIKVILTYSLIYMVNLLKNSTLGLTRFVHQHCWDALNADQPSHIHFCSLQDRIEYIRDHDSMAGESELTALCHVFKNTMYVFHSDAQVYKYGEQYKSTRPLYLPYMVLGEKVGHYEAMEFVPSKPLNDFSDPRDPHMPAQASPQEQLSDDNIASESSCIISGVENVPSVQSIIHEFSPRPLIKASKPGRGKTQTAGLVTSSP